MADKTKFHEIVRKVQLGKLTDKEIKECFVAEPDPANPFGFRIGFNANAVDISKVENAGSLAEPLMRDIRNAHESRSRGTSSAKADRKAGRQLPIIAEGDSWFDLPEGIYPQTMIDILHEGGNYSFLNLARWGDTLDGILDAGEFWRYFKIPASPVADTLVFSAGGNDMIGGGRLQEFLKQYDHEHSSASHAAWYILPSFLKNLDDVRAKYESVIQTMIEKNENAVVVGHGYDYVVPQPEGPWVGGPMMQCGLDPVYKAPLCRAIVKIMVDEWNTRLRSLQAKYSNHFVYVDVRNTMKENEWYDELHARQSGAKKLATKLSKAIDSLPTTRQVIMSSRDGRGAAGVA